VPFPVGGPAPWILWGSKEVATLTVAGSAGVFASSVSTHQLVKVSYGRPDNWRFLFTGRITGGVTPVAVPTVCHARFDVILGTGRDNWDTQKEGATPVPAQINAFCSMRWDVPLGTAPGLQNWNRKYTTSVPSPPLDDSALTTLQTIDHVVAQNIQCRARLHLSNGDLNTNVTVEVGAYFAPNVHIRPDWSQGRFNGQETGGK
jgi:hypothetical protein